MQPRSYITPRMVHQMAREAAPWMCLRTRYHMALDGYQVEFGLGSGAARVMVNGEDLLLSLQQFRAKYAPQFLGAAYNTGVAQLLQVQANG